MYLNKMVSYRTPFIHCCRVKCHVLFWRRVSTLTYRIMANSVQNNVCLNKSTSSLKSINSQYEEAIKALNSLQSNAAVLEEVRKQRKTCASSNLTATQKYLERVGIPLTELDKLSVIHVAGTKGKGSTCAFIESILREYGFKTGFYSSPHLVAVRERIRISGRPIPKKEFSHYFWDVYDTLMAEKESSTDMPAYFKFLTILALKVFIREEVDVAIVEVGIGGEYDCTNVIRNPIVCGITTLDIDHTSILGDTIQDIAWHKSGIMKCNVPTFTVSQQPAGAYSILQSRAQEKQSELIAVPNLEAYGWGRKPLHLGLSGPVQFLNASLALQISHYWMENGGNAKTTSPMKERYGKPFQLSEEDISALGSVVWPGRSQILPDGKMTYFLDGAHTSSSIQSCVQWFQKVSPLFFPCDGNLSVCRVLVFNLTGDRDHETFLQMLLPCNFDVVIFTTNLVSTDMSASSDQTNYTVSESARISRCHKLKETWQQLLQDSSNISSSASMQKSSDESSEVAFNSVNTERSVDNDPQSCFIFECISDALVWLSCSKNSALQKNMTNPPYFPQPEKLMNASCIQVLVTGSLHLVGGFLAILDPSLSGMPQTQETSSNSSMVDFVKNKYIFSHFSTPGAP